MQFRKAQCACLCSNNMAADIFTKALDCFKVQKCVAMLGLTSTWISGVLH